jgi:hypothetical protein
VRFIDNILLVFESEHDALDALAIMRNLDVNIRVGDHTVASEGHFLDLNLRLVPTNTVNWQIVPGVSTRSRTTAGDLYSVCCSLYRKETDLVVLLDFHSAHSWHLKLNVVFSQLVRILRLSTVAQSAGTDIQILMSCMVQFRHMPNSVKRGLWRKLLQFAVREFLTQKTARARPLNRNAPQKHYCPLRVPINCDVTYLKRAMRLCADILTPSQRYYVGTSRLEFVAGRSLQRILS